MRARFIAGAALLAVCAAPAHADYKQFKDWFAACDNLRNCHAYGWGAGSWTGAYLHLERSGAPNALPTVKIIVEAAEGVKVSLAFNDNSTSGLPAAPVTPDKGDDVVRIEIKDAASVDALITTLRKAETLTATRTDPPGHKSDEPKADISLSGAVAALLWIDEQQKRLGTTTALIRRGNKPASSVPPQSAAPVIRAAKQNPAPLPKEAPPAILAKGKTICGEDEGDGEFEEAHRLNGNLVLYAFYCRDSSGAYNHHYGYVIAPEGNPKAGKIPQFITPKIGDLVNERPAILVNPGFNPKAMTLIAFSKGRGIGDCGELTNWVWDGTAFRLALYDMMPDCKGVPSEDWPTLYRATMR